MLWSLPEKNIYDGDIVPVYIRSNINKVYVIGTPQSKEKIEVPLWFVSAPESKSKARKTAKLYAEYRHRYASVALDGLPVRSEAANTAKQVYRLRRDEVIKILYKGTGQNVMGGKEQLQGEWLMVLTEDGTKGWCFSHNLRIFDESVGIAEQSTDSENQDGLIAQILESRWFPEYYGVMINSRKIDPNTLKAEYGFDTGFYSGTTGIRLSELNVSYPYKGTEKISEKVYKFSQTPFTLTVRSSGFIAVQYIGQDGLPVSYNFVTITPPQNEEESSDTLGTDSATGNASTAFETAGDTGSAQAENENARAEEYIRKLAESETERRNAEYRTVAERGPVFSSSNYGKLTLNGDRSFSWSGCQLLISSGLLPQTAVRAGTVRGTVETVYFMSASVEQQFDGIFTFMFNDSEEVNFLYKQEETGLRLESVDKRSIQNGTVNARSKSPLVLFFSVR